MPAAFRYGAIVFILLLAGLYALPNIYGSSPALQVSGKVTGEANLITQLSVETALEKIGLPDQEIIKRDNRLFIRFDNEEQQIQTRDRLQQALGGDFSVVLNLVPNSPRWLQKIKAEPMPLGLDLRGGVHFLLQVDIEVARQKAEEGFVTEIKSILREEKIRYTSGIRDPTGGSLRFSFPDEDAADKAKGLITQRIGLFDSRKITAPDGSLNLVLQITPSQKTEIERNAVQQNITILRNRVNELGVAEPLVQQQGSHHIVVELPGVQDIARAKKILGETATLEFHLVDEEHDPETVLESGNRPIGSELYYSRQNTPTLLKKATIIGGEQIIDARAGIDPQSNQPDVSITLDGKGGARMRNITRKNVGRGMAVVFIHREMEPVSTQGKASDKMKAKNVAEVINVAVIREEFGRRFHITGLDSPGESRNLALLLRAGALAAPADIVEERTVGPSLGRQNIERGLRSGLIGVILLFFFIIWRYRYFGLLANIALACNFLLLVALLSLIQATLTLPGIVGIILTLGMAIDANVLIYERIREELRTGNSPRSAIRAGFDRAYLTILDSNITTLIAALALFNFGSGPIKGFAITLSLGILTSMFSALNITRAMVDISHTGKRTKKLWI